MTRMLAQVQRAAVEDDMPAPQMDTLEPDSTAEQHVAVLMNETLSDYGIVLLLNMVRRFAAAQHETTDSDDTGGTHG